MLSLSLEAPIRKCKRTIEQITLPKSISVASFNLIIQEMYEHWRQLALYDNEASVFPDDDLLDYLEIHEGAARRHVSGALDTLVSDFNLFLIDNDIFDWLCTARYKRIHVNKETLLFV